MIENTANTLFSVIAVVVNEHKRDFENKFNVRSDN